MNRSPSSHLPPLPKNPRIGIGCVGAGFILSECHLPAYLAAGLNPVAITSRNLASAQSVAHQHRIPTVHQTVEDLVANPHVEVVDIAVPPDIQPRIIERIARAPRKIRGILAQKPLAQNHAEGLRLVRLCEASGIRLVVNQNMRHDHAIRSCTNLLRSGSLGDPVLATIEMRAIPHWMPWQQRLGWVTLRIMSIHHLDTFRHWFGSPRRIYSSVRPDPRTATRFTHEDGICLSILEYDSGLRCSTLEDVWAGPAREGAEPDLSVRFRVEGTHGMALGSIGWPAWPARQPSTIDYTTTSGGWERPRWNEAWFPDAFHGPMCELLRDIEGTEPAASTGEDNLLTLALVDAAYLSAREHRAVDPLEIISRTS